MKCPAPRGLVRSVLGIACCLCLTVQGLTVQAFAATTSDLPPGSSPPARSLDVSLEPRPDGAVRFVVTNTSGGPLALLTRDTPFDKVLAHRLFDVTTTSSKAWPPVRSAPWIGRHAKRVPPGPEDVLLLAPGERVTASVPVAGEYRIERAGPYALRYVAGFEVAVGDGSAALGRRDAARPSSSRFLEAFEPVPSISGSVSLDLAATPVPSTLRVRPPTFLDCSAGEQGQIVEAAGIAQEYATSARTDLEGLPIELRPGSPRYRLWFGAYDRDRYARVTENFQAIESALVNETVNFDCGCDEAGVYAYVYPGQPWDIYLCPAFRSARPGGTDSRAGTLVHELSHFGIVAGTDDHAYSQGAAQSLAVSDPALAIDNADSHEYFAENTPATPIQGDGSVPEDTEPPGETEQPIDPALFEPLMPGSSDEGSIASGESALYIVGGASAVSLQSLEGDADLYVYSDAGLSESICASTALPDNIDSCELPPGVTSWIQVYGSSDSSFRLSAAVATGTDEGMPEVEVAGSLTGGVPITGEVAEGTLLGYLIADASSVELTTLRGDADLYVFESPEVSDDNVVCIANEYAEVSTIDACELLPDTPYFAVVFGYVDSDFSIIVSGGDREGDGGGAGVPGSGTTDSGGTSGTTGEGTGEGMSGEGVGGTAGVGGSRPPTDDDPDSPSNPAAPVAPGNADGTDAPGSTAGESAGDDDGGSSGGGGGSAGAFLLAWLGLVAGRRRLPGLALRGRFALRHR